MKPYQFLQGIDAGKLPPEAENYLREEILKSEALGQISPDAKEFKNVVELITSRYPDALPKGEDEKEEVKDITKEDYQKAIKGLTASIKYLPAGEKKNTQAAIKGLKIAMKYQKMEKGGEMTKGRKVWEYEVYDNGEWRKASQKDFKYWYDEFGAEVMDRFGKEHKKGEIPFSEVENIYNPQGYEVARKTKIEKSYGGSMETVGLVPQGTPAKYKLRDKKYYSYQNPTRPFELSHHRVDPFGKEGILHYYKLSLRDKDGYSYSSKWIAEGSISEMPIKSSGGSMEKGGRMPYSDYEGKTAGEVWDGWPGNQKEHFLSDHHNLWASESYEKRSRIINSKYTKLPFEIRKLIMAHISAGQYAGGGGLATSGGVGEKKYNIQHGIGKAKYVVNYHDGVKKHKDGSDFYDIAIFNNKEDLEKFEQKLLKENYISKS